MLLRLLFSRAVIASGALHVGLAAGMASGGSPHARSGMAGEAAVDALEIDVRMEDVETSASAPERPNDNETAPVSAKAGARAVTHEHPFAVPGHDVRPHDPSSPHAADSAGASDAPDLAAMPTFVLPSTGSMVAGSSRIVAAAAPVGAADGNGAASEATHQAGDVDVAAKVIATVPAAYPQHARAAGLEVDVALDIIVDDRGRVTQARAVQPGDREIDAAALAAVTQYRFSPAERYGHPVRVRMTWTVQFRLQ